MKANKDYRGKYSRDVIQTLLNKGNMHSHNKEKMIQYFCEGIRIKDLGISKQLATKQINKVILILDPNRG